MNHPLKASFAASKQSYDAIGNVGIQPLAESDRKTAGTPISEATRYLAAAAHSDVAFRRTILKDVHYAPLRCKAPEFGVDGQFVTNQCLLAERRRKVRDALLLAIVLIFLASSGALSDFRYAMDDPSAVSDYLQLYGSSLAFLILVGAAIVFGEWLIFEHFTLRRRFAKPIATTGELLSISPRQNLIVYGGYAPFVGSGLSLGAWDWSFAADLRKTKEGDGRQAEAVSVAGLIKAIGKRLADLAMPNLEQYHVLFADGRHIREDQQLMPSPYQLPPNSISDEMVAQYSNGQENRCRTYFCIAITDWSGELVMTTYVRAKKGKSHLFVEASHFILPPLKTKYYELDSTDPVLKLRLIVQHALSAIVATPFLLILSPFKVIAAAAEPIQRWSASRQIRKAVRDNPVFNYGALTSIRQLASENRFRIYFQQLDRDMHLKTIEICLIDAVVSYLDDLGIDTSDIRERRTAILNTGVMITGGTVNAESVVAGSGAKSVISRIKSGILSGGNQDNWSQANTATNRGGQT